MSKSFQILEVAAVMQGHVEQLGSQLAAERQTAKKVLSSLVGELTSAQ